MATHSEIQDQAYQFFIEEAPELLQLIETGLLNLQQERSTAKIHDLMRAAHSIKGGAASVGLEAIKTLAHRLEDIFKAFYSDEVQLDTELESLLLKAYDCLRNPLIQQIQEGYFDPEQALASAQSTYAQIEERLGDALTQVHNYIPSSGDLGIDIVSSIFEVDVAQGLERLAAVLANPQNYEVVGELKAQAEVFAGFAELLNLSGFGAIAQTAIAAVEQNPHQVLKIIELALADFTTGRAAVLAGDRTQGGNPSTALVALTQAPAAPTNDITNSLNTTSEFEDIFSDFNLGEATNAFDDFTLSEQTATEPSQLNPLGEETFETSPTLADQETDLDQATVDPPSWKVTDSADVTDIFSNFNQDQQTLLFEDVALGQETTGQQPQVNLPAQEVPLSAPIVADLRTSDLGQASLDLPSDQSTPSEDQVNPVQEEEASFPEETISPTAETVQRSEQDLSNSKADPTPGSKPVANSPNPSSTASAPRKNSSLEVPKTLEAAVEKIEQIFESLPPLQDMPASDVPSPPTLPAAAFLANELAINPSTQSGKSQQHQPIQPNRATSKPSEHPSQSPTSISPESSVRVNLKRLERMNNQVGELVINRNSIGLQNEQLQGAVRELTQRFDLCQTIVSQLQDLSDQSLASASSAGSMVSNPSFASLSKNEWNQQGTNSVGERNLSQQSVTWSGQKSLESESDPLNKPLFDSLEMDSYSNVHALIQGLQEEMMLLKEAVGDITLFAQQSDQTLEQQRQMLSQLRDELMWARMLPLGQVLNRFPRALRDLSTQHHKPAKLKLSGTGVLVDRAVLEKLYDPLLHLLRNAFDHGIESPQIRRKRGKSEQGQIEIRAYHKGNQTIIQVKDDGEGLNIERIRNQVLVKGLLSAKQIAKAPPSRLLKMIFEPGFSTAAKVSELSGRGVGLDVVRSQIRALKGKISVTSSPGKGTTFTLRLPLTLTIAKLLIATVGPIVIALPSDSIEEIVVPKGDQMQKSGTKRFLLWRGQMLPTYTMSDLLEYNCPVRETTPSKALVYVPTPEDWALPLVVMRREQQAFALEIDRVITEQELVIKPFGKALAAPSYTYGCTILGDGSLIPVIDGNALLEQFLAQSQEETQPRTLSHILEATTKKKSSVNRTQTPAKTAPIPTILIVDDSTGLRRTLAMTLQKAGYRVLQARDGQEALEQLRQSSKVQMIICDIEMPNMNGFEFLGQRRQDPQLSKIPIAMLTSRSSEKHQRLAMHLGANAYFTKPYIEQYFIGKIKKIIEQSKSEV
ncbi:MULTISPECIES: hybrid sensor histidine kinase/response regulator [Moorena]|uniref:histidine kinase n=4 Tax=Moorena TaxID=1155738 RepID=F4XUU3_9CYAN|nr:MULTISPECIES: hybrid sensor histidine kinase/response regulator [Moorena]EGJ31646.1 chemotaxis protein, histidine kinase family [Moorena producens 3L]OLT66031.1 hybrid sensor histidine kinase/response regulator [Moorena producens 3L]